MGPLRTARSTFFKRFSSPSRSISSRRCSKTSMLIILFTFDPFSLWSIANRLGPRLPLYRGSGWRRIVQKVDQGVEILVPGHLCFAPQPQALDGCRVVAEPRDRRTFAE